MKVWTPALATLLCMAMAFPQDLDPGVLLLARFKAHIRDELSRLPNYTCLETISRFHKGAGSGTLKPLDTVRLEIIYSDHKEWYGSPGDRTLNITNPAGLVGSGLMGTGAFASALHNILTGAHFTYRGEEPFGGRSAIRFDFQFPRQPVAFEISIVGGAGTVGEKGSLWLDRQSLDLIRMELHADDIPAYLPLAEQNTTVNYARMKIGESDVLLAQDAAMGLVEGGGVTNYDHFEFTHCRAFSAEGAIRFDAEPGTVTQSAPVPAPVEVRALPALLRVIVQLATPVSHEDAVGKLIEGKVAQAVPYKGKTLIPEGAVVHGRIRRLERYQGNTVAGLGAYIVGLEFTEVEATSGRVPFYADLLSLDKSPEVRATLSERVRAGNATITLPELPGVASFFVTGSNFVIPAGFRTVWRTRGPIRGINSAH